MESETESSGKDVTVKDLQASLFPPTPKSSTSFFSNFYIKSNFDEDLLIDESLKKETPSRELFSLNRETNFVAQPPRWPTECQVLEEKVKHISYLPPTVEPYYVPTGKEPQPKPTGEECGIIVYQYTPISAVNYFSRSSVGGSRYLLPACLCPEEDTLRFESRFESGNLARAIRITPNFYELYLRADMYTNRHMQWFYFRVTNTKKNFLYRFSIVNFSKEDSLYNEGMRPLMYSTKDSQLHSIGWRRCGDNVTYYSNDNVSPEDPEAQMTYTLSFTMEFPHDDDEVYLAHCYPYTYSDLEEYLTELSNHPIKTAFTTIRLLCKSLAGNNVHYITITSPPVPGEAKKKRSVVITARVHPGETPSSWMMKGFLDFLTSDCGVAKELRDKFIFKLVPMLNPDGVIVGNNRCSLSAKDLNRQYRTVMRDAYPSIWYTKLMVRRLLEECGVAMYCDLHAHSRKHNIFIYGCENRRGAERKLQEQVFPLMLHKNTADKNRDFEVPMQVSGTSSLRTRDPLKFLQLSVCSISSKRCESSIYLLVSGIVSNNRLEFGIPYFFKVVELFSFESCKFRIQKAKEGTGRVVMWMMGIANSYTMESSFAGSTLGTRSESHFTTQDFEQMAKSFCQTLLDFYDDDPRKEKLRNKIINRLVKEGSNADEPTNIQLSDYSSDEGDTSSSSSNEVGRDDDDIFYPAVPPPSPIVYKKLKPKVFRNKNKLLNRSPNATRKPLPICKATVGLYLSEKESKYTSDSSSEDEENYRRPKPKIVRKRQKKKKGAVKKKEPVCAFSDCEIQYKENTVRSISVFDLIPNEKIRTNSYQAKRSKTPQPRLDKKNVVTQQLAEVQVKLLSLKNKIWFGVSEGENVPLSWGRSHFSFPDSSSLPVKKKNRKKSACKHEKNDKKNTTNNKECKTKTEVKSKPTNGLRRQTAVDWGRIDIKKTKSLPESQTKLVDNKSKMTVLSCDEDDKTDAKKKKKKRTKFGKRAKTVSNAKIFFTKD